jgi:hypothetical protein
MRTFLERVFRYLKVDDPRQTKVNYLLFTMIVGWISLGLIVNTVSYLFYFFVTLPRLGVGTVQEQSIIQIMPDVGLAAEKGYLIVIGALIGALGLMARVIIVLWNTLKDERAKGEARERENTNTLRALETPITRMATLVEQLTQ